MLHLIEKKNSQMRCSTLLWKEISRNSSANLESKSPQVPHLNHALLGRTAGSPLLGLWWENQQLKLYIPFYTQPAFTCPEAKCIFISFKTLVKNFFLSKGDVRQQFSFAPAKISRAANGFSNAQRAAAVHPELRRRSTCKLELRVSTVYL